MDCSEFKLVAGAEPQRLSPAARHHMSACAACERYAQHMLSLDALLQRALQLPVTNAPGLPLTNPPRASTTRWLALAASLLLTVFVVGGGWLLLPRSSLASELIEHVSAEQDIVAAAKPLSSDELQIVLRRTGVRLNSTPQHPVWYAMSCPFRGQDVPHLIVETAQGRVTVLLLARERVRAIQSFDEQGFRGTILPSGPGSIAIIAAKQAAIEEAAKHVAAAVEWIK
jgi:hypothetical protein